MGAGVHEELVAYPDPRERMGWLDLLKAVSAFAVVMTHVASIGWQAMGPSEEGWLVTSVYEIVTRFAVPVFFMTSGALLLNPRRRVGVRRILVSYAGRTAVLALVVSLLYCLLERALFGWTGWRSLITSTLDGPYFIWYLWVLVGLYAMTPVFRLVAERPGALGYALAVLALLVMGKSTVEAMFPGSWLAVWLGNFLQFGSGMEGVFYYLLGAWLISRRPSRRKSALAIALGVASLVIAIAANYASALAVGPDLYYVARDNVFIALFSIGTFEAFRLLEASFRGGAVLSTIVSCGMSIYLIHPFLRLLMEGLDFFSPVVGWLLAAPLVSVPVVSLVLWGLSLALSLVISAPLARGGRGGVSGRRPAA